MKTNTLAKDATDNKNRLIPQSFIHLWNNTTEAEVENIKLKMQVDVLIGSLSTNNQTINEIDAKVSNIHRIFNATPEVIEKPAKKLSPAKQRLQDIVDFKEAEKIEMLKKIRQNQNAKSSALSSSTSPRSL
jgi:hypothetical protein